MTSISCVSLRTNKIVALTKPRTPSTENFPTYCEAPNNVMLLSLAGDMNTQVGRIASSEKRLGGPFGIPDEPNG